MKRKPLNIVLIIILVFIWGSIIHKYFGKDETEKVSALNTPVTYTYNKEISSDTFQLELTNTNPFKSSIRKRPKRQTVKNSEVKRSKTVDKNIPWPEISYHGFVKSQDKKTKLVILKVNNRLYRKREKETIDQLLVIKAYEDSLILSNNKELKTIQKINETL